MSKRNYKITKHNQYFLKVEMWNDYGMKRTFYEENIIDASDIIMDWWEKSDKEYNKMKVQQQCISSLVKNETINKTR